MRLRAGGNTSDINTNGTDDPVNPKSTFTEDLNATEASTRITPEVRKARVPADSIDALENAATMCEAALLAADNPHTHHVLSVGIWACEHPARDLKGDGGDEEA